MSFFTIYQRFSQRLIHSSSCRHYSCAVNSDFKDFHHELAPGSLFLSSTTTKAHGELLESLRKIYKSHGFQEVITPNILNTRVLSEFEENLDKAVHLESEKIGFVLKTSNLIPVCVLHMNRFISHRFYPIRYLDFGVLHEYDSDQKKVLRWQKDDAYSFCKQNKLSDELYHIIKLIGKETKEVTGFVPRFILNPDKDLSNKIVEIVEQNGFLFDVDKRQEDTIRVISENSSRNRIWDQGKLNFNYQTPAAMDLIYTDENQVKVHPVIINFTMIGSFQSYLDKLQHQIASEDNY